VLCNAAASAVLGGLWGAGGEEPLRTAVVKEPEGSCGTGAMQLPSSTVGLRAGRRVLCKHSRGFYRL